MLVYKQRGWFSTSLAGEPLSDCLFEPSALRSSRCFLSSANLAFFASISSRRCAIESMMWVSWGFLLSLVGFTGAPDSVWSLTIRSATLRFIVELQDCIKHVFGGLLPKTRQAGTVGPSSAKPVLASRKILVEEPHSPAATQPPRQPSARLSRDPRDAIDSRLSFASPAIGHARRAIAFSRIQQRQPQCLLPWALTYVHASPELPMHYTQLGEASISASDAKTVANAMIAGSPMGCPGYRCLLRPLQPGLDIIA